MLLTNFEMDSKLIVSFILAGQPRLREILHSERLQDIAQRIFHHVELRLLSADESLDYMRHRCTIAGMKTFPFDEKSARAIFEITRGNMRAIDHLALKSLEMATKKNIGGVDEGMVLTARKSLWL